RTNKGQAPQSLRCLKGSITRPVAIHAPVVIAITRVGHQCPDHVRARAIKAFRIENDVAPPADERRWRVEFEEFVIAVQWLAINPHSRRPVSYDPHLA